MKWSFLLLLTVLSSFAQAQDVYQFCASLSFDHEKQDCLKIAQEAQYFDRGALRVCADLNFTHEKLSCLRAIKEKSYEDGELRLCGSMSFSHQINECLQNAGRVDRGTRRCRGDALRDRMQDVLSLLETGRSHQAEGMLRRLLYRFDDYCR